MSHLEDQLAEFVFEDLTGPEMEAARQHVAQCLECQGRVAGFRKVQHSLEQLPDVDVPRRMVFLPSETRAKTNWAPLRWAIPSAIAVALVLAVVLGGPLRFERLDSGFVIGLGPVSEPTQTAELQAVLAEVSVSPTIDYASLDYAQIVDRIREEEEGWLRAEIDQAVLKLEVAGNQEIQRLRAELQYFSELQRSARRVAYENASSIQLLAAQTGRE